MRYFINADERSPEYGHVYVLVEDKGSFVLVVDEPDRYLEKIILKEQAVEITRDEYNRVIESIGDFDTIVVSEILKKRGVDL